MATPTLFHKKSYIRLIRFDFAVICICFAEQVFLLDLARVQSLPSYAPAREEPRDAVSELFTPDIGR